jgi:Domain of unknown function (DUF222)
LDPLAKPRNSAIEDENGKLTQLPDKRPYVQRLHDGLDEAWGRLLKSKDQPSVGGVPASVIVTIDVEDLLAKAGLAETADGSQLTSDQLLRIADEAEIWPTITNWNGVPLALGRSQRLASKGPNHGVDRSGCWLQFSRLHALGELVRAAPHRGLDCGRAD